jgi:sigma-B regulation protein RsbU (phosphoserine phosphatase)
MTEAKQKILIVDDERLNITVLNDLLKSDYKIMAAISGKQALKAAQSENPPDLILLDIMMPEMDGYEVCSILKANEKTKDIPVIFVTAMGQTSDETKGLEVGAVDYLTKPISPPIVHARVMAHLKLKKQRDELNEAYRLIESQKARMEDELSVGRDIQMSMVPQVFPPYPNRYEFTLHAKLFPAREVGGDFYDYFFIDDDHLCLCVGDVSGKGVPAALFMAVTRTLMKARASEDSSTASIMTRVNDELSRDNKMFMFVTVFISILEISSGKLTYTNAGHNPSFICRPSGEIERLDTLHGPVAAASPELAYKESTINLQKDDLLFVYTDGVTEARNLEKEFFKEERLAKLLVQHHYKDAAAAVDHIFDEVKSFEGKAEQFDDITLLALKYLVDSTTDTTDLFHHIIPNQLAEISRVNREFNTFSEKHGITTEIRRQFNLVLDELLNNVISYAYCDKQEHEIEIACRYHKDRLILSISDDGIPFNPFVGEPPDTAVPLAERPIGGLGIHLVQNLMDKASYRRQVNKNVVTLVKYFSDNKGS